MAEWHSGPEGAPGRAGAEGAEGRAGAEGQLGRPGAEGPEGRTGTSGADGADGAVGAEGAAGAPGKQGPRGLPGHGLTDWWKAAAGAALVASLLMLFLVIHTNNVTSERAQKACVIRKELVDLSQKRGLTQQQDYMLTADYYARVGRSDLAARERYLASHVAFLAPSERCS